MAQTGKRRTAKNRDRIAVVAGLRTPFARQLTAYRDMNAIDLGILVTSELLARTDIDPALVDRVVYGQVIVLPEAPNIAREVVLGTGMRPQTDAYSVSRACATSFQAAVDIAQAIQSGEIDAGIAGGADSTSILPMQLGRGLAQALLRASKARSLRRRISAFAAVRPRDLLPRPPALRDYSTGLGMGDIAEQMARNHGITREDQDEFVLRSHQRAHEAWEQEKLRDEVMPAFVPPYSAALERDNTIRSDTTLEQLAGLRPAFDRRHGTVTAGNSTALTDGASSLLLMRETRAREIGLEALGFIRAWAMSANDPFNDGLMGPSHATPLALKRAGLALGDMQLVDMHEAFAAQTLANIRNWPSKRFAREHLGLDQAIGDVDPDRFNVLGGSIAYGHPFAATGGRMIVQTLHELRRRGGGTALATACAAGGLGAAMILEVA